MLWGLDALKPRAITRHSPGTGGAETCEGGTGRIVRYELKSLAEVGHPALMLGNLSFFEIVYNIIELPDDLFQRAADAEEPEDQNFIRKHTLRCGVRNRELSCSVVSNPAGDFGLDGQ